MSGPGEKAEISFTARTDAGMFALWNPARFVTVTDYQSWETALLEDEDIAARSTPDRTSNQRTRANSPPFRLYRHLLLGHTTYHLIPKIYQKNCRLI